IGSGPRDARDVGTPPRDARDINGTGVDMRSRSGSTGSTVGDSGAMGSNPQDARDINGSGTGSAGGIGGPGSAERELEDDPYSGTTGATGTMNRRSGVESPLERQDRIRSEQRRREMERQGGRLPGATPPEGSI